MEERNKLESRLHNASLFFGPVFHTHIELTMTKIMVSQYAQKSKVCRDRVCPNDLTLKFSKKVENSRFGSSIHERACQLFLPALSQSTHRAAAKVLSRPDKN